MSGNRLSTHILTLRLFFVCLLSLFFSCGIDEYIFLEPISSVTLSSSDSQKITVSLPSQSVYFDEYLIYYRIYPSSTASSNSVAASNWATIYNANQNYPATLETVIKSLSFKVLGFAKDTQVTTVPTSDYLTNPLKASNISSNSITSFVIDFNTPNREYPCLIINDSTKYRLIRNSDLNMDDKYKDLLYYNTITNSILSSEQYKDYYYISGYSRTVYPFAHVQLIAVAVGHDSSFSQLYSTACQLGVFQLNDAAY